MVLSALQIHCTKPRNARGASGMRSQPKGARGVSGVKSQPKTARGAAEAKSWPQQPDTKVPSLAAIWEMGREALARQHKVSELLAMIKQEEPL